MKCGSCSQAGQILASCPYCRGSGTIPETFCHCGEPTVNGTRTLCGPHTDELRLQNRREAEERIAALRARFRYFIPNGDLGVEFRDAGAWRSYEIADAFGDTAAEFLSQLTVSEVDQDGGELASYGFEDAPSAVREAILAACPAYAHDEGHHDDGEDHTSECAECRADAEASMKDAMASRPIDFHPDEDGDDVERRIDAADEARKRAKGE